MLARPDSLLPFDFGPGSAHWPAGHSGCHWCLQKEFRWGAGCPLVGATSLSGLIRAVPGEASRAISTEPETFTVGHFPEQGCQPLPW